MTHGFDFVAIYSGQLSSRQMSAFPANIKLIKENIFLAVSVWPTAFRSMIGKLDTSYKWPKCSLSSGVVCWLFAITHIHLLCCLLVESKFPMADVVPVVLELDEAASQSARVAHLNHPK